MKPRLGIPSGWFGAAGNASTRLEMSLAGRGAFSTKQKAVMKKSVAISKDDATDWKIVISNSKKHGSCLHDKAKSKKVPSRYRATRFSRLG